jgi:predicted transcriptional regulator
MSYPQPSHPSELPSRRRRITPTIGRHKKLTGVSLDPEVVEYLDHLAARMRMNRSFVLNTIVQEYAKLVEGRTIQPRPYHGVDAVIQA